MSLSFEGLPQEITVENEPQFLPVRNKMQIMLVIRYAERNGKDSKEVAENWLNTYSKKFGDAFKKLYNEDHNLFKEFKEDPDYVLTLIEGEIYKEDEASVTA